MFSFHVIPKKSESIVLLVTICTEYLTKASLKRISRRKSENHFGIAPLWRLVHKDYFLFCVGLTTSMNFQCGP